MRKILAVAFVFVAACASAEPQKPEGADSVASQSKEAKTATGNPATPGTQPAGAPPNATEDTKADATKVGGSGNNQPQNQSVSIERMPPLDIPRDAIDYTQLLLTVVVLALTIGQIIYSHKSTDAATKAANAAQKSADVARDALVLTQRGRLSVERAKVEFRKFDEAPQIRLHVTITFRNVGPTPVNVTESQFDSGSGHPDDLPDKWEFPKPPRPESYPVVQGDTFEQIKWINFENEAALDRFKDGKNVIFVFGYAKYTDTIEPERIRTTQYARLHNPARRPPITRAIQKPHYNYAD